MSPLSYEDRRTLLGIARHSISTAVLQKSLPDLEPVPATLAIIRGVFVSLHIGGNLRGCVGQVEDPGPLAEAVCRAAINAALHDPRFPPVTEPEISAVEIEISVLSSFEPIAMESIVPGTHGLFVKQRERKGLLLPQIAAERKWNGQRFLEETCAKAGLPRYSWRDPMTQVFAFTAEVFSEFEVQFASKA